MHRRGGQTLRDEKLKIKRDLRNFLQIKLKNPRWNVQRICTGAAGYLSRAWRKGREYRSASDLPHDARRRRYTYTYRRRHESSVFWTCTARLKSILHPQRVVEHCSCIATYLNIIGFVRKLVRYKLFFFFYLFI